jgi:hypothetical protein
MTRFTTKRSFLAEIGLACCLIAAMMLMPGCVGNVLPPGDGGDGGTGTLAGTVTNRLTGAGLSGVAVAVDPPVEGVDITTGTDGSFEQELPIGVYAVTVENANYETFAETASVLSGESTALDVALMPVEPVVVTVAVEGDAVPGGTVTATASVEVLDGSNVQSYAWSQAQSVEVDIAGATTNTATVTLPAIGVFKDELITVLAEPPIGEEELPPNVPLPEGEFPGGLQDRFEVVGLNPFSLEEAALVGLEVAVTTSSGTYTADGEIHAELPWKPTLGIRNVPVGIPVLLQGKDQDTYDWALNGPAGSSAALVDATTQNPYFTPDASGLYRVAVTDATGDAPEDVTLELYAGTWEGAITGQDADGRPVAAACSACHNGTIAPDKFTPWAQTGHAEIFTDSLNTNDHYSTSCLVCHTVGFDTEVANGGFDDADDYDAFLDMFSTDGVNIHSDPNNWNEMLEATPATAQLANIQCENCHGPQNGGAHLQGAPRIDIRSDVCGSCHGEPLRHGRFQQWQLSGHANYELAIDEGGSGSCARCHTGNGFLVWLPILLDDDPATDPLEDIAVTWTTDETHPQTCAVCHDPHSIGTVSGEGTDATVRISDDTPPLIAGFTAFGVGKGAICMTCHNSRRGLRNDSTFAETRATDAARAPHGSAQSDVLMGQNAYFVDVGIRGSHSLVEDTCVNCHMRQTPPPGLLSYNQGGTNHTFFASEDICAECHNERIDAAGVEMAFEAGSEALQGFIEEAILQLISDQITAGNTIDLDGERMITAVAEIGDVEFGEAHGRQAITVTFTDGTVVGPLGMSDISVVDGEGVVLGELYDFADDRLIKAGWNWNLVNNDGSKSFHNVPFVDTILVVSTDEVLALIGE